MKQHLSLWAMLTLLQGASPGAPVIIPAGGLTYMQNFDNLSTTTNNNNTTVPWADDGTIPGWWLYRAGNGTPTGFAGASYVYRVADGLAAITVGQFQSMGANGSADRALGNPSTTGQGEMAAIAVFQNTSGSIVELSRVKHNIEVLRTNDGANNVETICLWWRTGASQAEVLSLTTGATNTTVFPGSISSAPTSHYITGWNRLAEADAPYSNGTASLAVNFSTAVDVVPVNRVRIAPGQFFALRYGNINDAGADALMGIDDVELTFSVLEAALVPSISNVVRNNAGTPTEPFDDTVDFTLTVTGTGSVSPSGWTLAAPFTLAGQTGAYGVPKTFTGLTLGEFSGAEHTLDVVVQDQGNPAVMETAVVTAPWCRIIPVVTNVFRDDKSTPGDLFDDEWGYTLTVNAEFGGTGFNSNNAVIPVPGAYGTPYTVSGLPIAAISESTTIFDAADSFCTASVTVSAPRIIGTKNFGAPGLLYTDSGGVPANWIVDETALTQRMNNGGGAPPKEYRSEVLDLTGIGEVSFSATLLVGDTSSGFEVDDTFNVQLIINGDTANPVSLVALYDTLPPANGIMNGAEISPATVGPPPVSGGGTFTHQFNALVPASANSVQLVISGNNNSANETMTVQNILFEIAGHSIVATLVPGVQFDNKGTVTAADDEFRQGVNILGVSAPPASTGWTGNFTPAAGLYTDPNPVLFGPFLQSVAARDLILTDNGVPAVTATLNIPSPVPAMTVTFVDGVRNTNGTADPADDTATLRYQISATIGGPSFVFDTSPCGITADNDALTDTAQTVTLTVTDLPTGGNMYFRFHDASYPASGSYQVIGFQQQAVTQCVVARKDLGGGPGEVLATALPALWINYPSVPAVQLSNGSEVITSELVDLSGVSGPVNFTANIRITDLTSGTETDDTLKVELILDGNTVNLITPHDADSSGLMNGPELAPGVTPNRVQVFNYPISHVIPDNVNSAQLVITGTNNSTNEVYLVEDALFSTGTPVADTDGDGQTDAAEAVAGTDPNDPRDYLRITDLTPGAGSVDLTFPSKAGRNYQAEASNDLNGLWIPIGPVTPGTGADITAPVAPVPVPGETKFFLRVRVVQ